jgi:glycosyltransferase involved in cell wall biosynthesis
MENIESPLGAPLRIALVTETYPPEINGVAITLGRMVEGLLKRQHAIHVIRPKQGKDDVAKSAEGFTESLVHGLPIPGYPELKSGLPAKRKLLQLWRQQRPDIVHVATEGPLGWSACSAAKLLNIPVCSDFHTNFHNYSQHYGMGWLKNPIGAYLRHFHNRTQCTLVPTSALQSSLSQEGYRDVRVVSRGIDTVLFHPDKRSMELRRRWGVEDGALAAILVSRLAAEKNLPLVIQAFEQIQSIRPNARLVMVGDGPARTALQQQFPQIIFTGMRSGEDLARHYASADIFLYPSVTETYGNVTVEAMASGLAVLAYDYAAAREHVQHEINGLVAPFDDAHAFMSLAKGMVHDDDRLWRMRRNARDSVEHLTWEKINARLESILTGLVQKHQHGTPDFTPGIRINALTK